MSGKYAEDDANEGFADLRRQGKANEDPVMQCGCDIRHEGDWKYIVVLVNDKTTGVTTSMFVSYPEHHYHSDIAKSFQRQLPDNCFLQGVQGGGIVTIDHAKKQIRTYGKSGGYGRPQLPVVQRILESHPPFAGYSFDLTITDYIRD